MLRLGTMAVNRRHFILLPRGRAGARGCAARRAAAAAPFAPTRFSVEVRGRRAGRDPDPGPHRGPRRLGGTVARRARLSLPSGPGRRLRRRAGARQCARARSWRRSPTEIARYIAASAAAAPRDRRPFDGRHARDDDRRAPSRAGRPGHGGRHAARSPPACSAAAPRGAGALADSLPASPRPRRPPPVRLADRARSARRSSLRTQRSRRRRPRR